MRKTCCALGIGMMMAFLLMKKKKKCCNVVSDCSSGNTSSSNVGLDYFSKISNGLDFIESKIDEIDIESMKMKTKDSIESIRNKIQELRTS